MRMRTAIPAIIVSALPATAADYTACFTAVDSMRCIIETAEFARQRNAEIDASIARVAQNRAMQSRHQSRVAAAATYRDAQVQKRFEDEQNRLSAASVARVYAERERAEVAHLNSLATLSVARVDAERQRAFVVARNVEINASVARVAQARAAEYAAATTHCNGATVTPRCAAEFARARNAEIEASVARVAAVRKAEYAAMTSHCANAPASPRCETQQIRDFARARNAEIERSIAAVLRERSAAIVTASTSKSNVSTSHCDKGLTPRCEAEMHRNQVLAACKQAGYTFSGCSFSSVVTFSTKTVDYSVSHCDKGPTPRCEAERARSAAGNAAAPGERADAASHTRNAQPLTAGEYATFTSHCAGAPASPRCEAEQIREFARARNAEVERSIAAVNRARAARSAQTAPPLTASEHAALTSHCVSAPDSPRCTAEQVREFARARNAEIERSIAAVNRARAASVAAAAEHSTDFSRLETGALGSIVPSLNETMNAGEKSSMRAGIAAPCRTIGVPFSPLPFASGTDLDDTITPELDRVAAIALACPGVRVEIHGYSDNRGPAFSIRRMSQARAQVAVDYLIASGVAPNRVVAIGRASAEPRFPNTTEANRARNRRIEIVIRDPGMQEAARRVMWDLAELLDPTYIPAVAGLSP